MEFIVSQSGSGLAYQHVNKKRTVLNRFFSWAANEDAAHHVAWVGISVTLTSAVFFPMTMTAILLNGANFSLIIGAMTTLALVVVVNLAAMPTKYTIPLFFLCALSDLGIILASFFTL
jgi:hypothetical protein